MEASDPPMFYEPRLGHGLPHDPFKAIIAPRPIGWISTVNAEGRTNLAPYSFFNAVHSRPPMLAFTSETMKHSAANSIASGEFVFNLCTRPLFDAMNDMLDPERVTAHLEKGVIEVAPLAFMRGRTLNDSFVILDEAQNTSPEQMKMFLTRLGFGSKMVVNGDVSQIDLPRDQRSGLVEVTDILERVEGIEVVRFGNEDVVRHKLVQRIVQAYAEHAERSAPELRPAKHQRRP